MADPDSIDEWLSLCRQHEISATALSDNKTAALQGYFHAGLAVECALKAYIMWAERLNSWPSRDSRPELYTHDLRALREMAGIIVKPTEPQAPCWHVVLQWDRAQNYNPRPMPRKVAKSMCEAALGADGVVTWIRQKLTSAS